MSDLYLPQNITQADLAAAVLKELRARADAFEREYVGRDPDDVSFSGTTAAAAKLGITCIPKVPMFDRDAEVSPPASCPSREGGSDGAQ